MKEDAGIKCFCCCAFSGGGRVSNFDFKILTYYVCVKTQVDANSLVAEMFHQKEKLQISL